MYEFDTVSASSYDPSALASKLTQKSAEGWEVLSIVPTGGDVTAFVRRAVGADAPAADTPAADVSAAPAVAAVVAPEAEPAAPSEPVNSIWSSTDDTTAATYTPEPAATYTPEPAATYTPEPAATYTPEPAATYTPEPAATYTPQAEEPAGWGAVAEPAAAWSPDPAPAPEPAPTPEPAPEPEPVVETPAYDPAPAQQVPSVPAGWYADPAGRFELRYWDGGQWTEHVARGGAQYTDPPVA
jgi:hypothetical protein